MVSAEAKGEGAIAVAIEGSGNNVELVAGGTRLRIERRHTLSAAPQKPIDLLIVERRASTLVGREAELAALEAWRDGEAPVAVRCITGRGGAGKTRLAIEACEAAEAAGWTAGFVSSSELRRFDETQNLGNWALPKPVLIVIDYAASSQPSLKNWFAALARGAPHGHPLRILLLERHADTETGWWAELNRRDSLSVGAADLLAGERPYPLAPITNVEDRRAILAQAMQLAAPLLDPPGPEIAPPPPGANPDFDARLADSRIDNEPLYLLMAGIHAARHGAPAALALDRDELADKMAIIEAKRMTRRAKEFGHGDDGALLTHIAACITLQNGVALPDLRALISQEAQAMEMAPTFSAERAAGHLCELLPEFNGRLEPVRPDLIGEAFLLREMKGNRFRSDEVRAAIITRAWTRAPGEVIDALVRSAQDFAGGSAGHPSVTWLRAIAEQSTEVGDLIRLSNVMPEQTLALREFAAAILLRISYLLRADGSEPIAIASTANNLANRLSDLGRREEALDVAQEGVSLRRALAAERPDGFTPDLAGSLNNLANRLFDLGRREEALDAAQEAVTLRRALAAERPDAFTPDVAGSLNNLANCLAALGRREDALGAAQEAVSLRRALAAERPDAFTPGLAMSLNNLANRLSALGRREEALGAAQEAVSLYRALVAERPDAFTPDLAGSLNNLAACLSALGRREEALGAAQEAVSLYRALTAARPDAFTPDLAMSFNNLANRLSALGRREEALGAAQEAVSLYRALTAERPDAFTPDLAGSLNNLANFLYALGRREEALSPAQEAVALRRAQAAERPDAFTPDLAMSLNNLANFLSAVGRREEALGAAQEGVALRRALAAERPDAFTPDLAGSLNNLAGCLSALGRREEALSSAQEAVALRRSLAAERPDAFTPDLAGSLNNLAAFLSALGRREDALGAAQEAVALRRALAAERPDAFTPDLAMSLSVLGDMLEAFERITEAVTADREACATLLPAFLALPQAFAGAMATYAKDYLRRAEAAGIEPDAELLERIVAVFREEPKE